MPFPAPRVAEKFRAAYGREPEFVARAPGRIEFIGNHTDYNGGTVLGAAIDRGIWVALARREDGVRRFMTDQRAESVTTRAECGEKLSGSDAWANYPLGVLTALPACGVRVPAGLDYLAVSNLPAGAGLSSSAAIELASAVAFAAAADESPERATLVTAARRAENEFVGVPCGILDQGVSAFGKKDHLVFIDCAGPQFETVPLPSDAHFWVFNTHTQHALVDGLYAARHRECMAAAAALGVARLADVSPSALAASHAKLGRTEAKRARHVVEEIARVNAAVTGLHDGNLSAVGHLLTASHRSSQMLFENSTAELDHLVDTLETAPHVHGARLTGGGFGGAVMALTASDFSDAAAQHIAEAFAARFGTVPAVLHLKTADGAELMRGTAR